MHWTLQGFLWLASPCIELVVALQMLRIRAWKEYPLFWSYLLCEIARTALLFAIGSDDAHYATYFYAYWITECIVCLLGFFVVAEVFRNTFSRKMGLRAWGTAAFRLSFLGLIVLALWAANAAPGNDSSKLVAAIMVLKRAESLVRLGLIAAVFLFVAVLGLPWKNYSVGIAAGFALYGAVELSALVLRSRYGPLANRTYTWSIMVVALCQNLMWSAYFLRRQSSNPVPIGLAKPLDDRAITHAELEKASEAVEVFLER